MEHTPMRRSLAFATGVAAMAVLNGCSQQTPTVAATEQTSPAPASSISADPPAGLTAEAKQAWRTWKEQDLSNYSYQLGVACFCAGIGSKLIVVEDGHVVSVNTRPFTKGTRLTGFGQFAPTIDNLFTMLGKVTPWADEVTASFDPELGNPADIYVDASSNGSDDEMSYDVDNLTAG